MRARPVVRQAPSPNGGDGWGSTAALRPSSPRLRADAVVPWILAAVASTVIVLLVLFTIYMVREAAPAIGRFGFGFLTGTTWDPGRSVFGILPHIYGTLMTAAIAIVLGVPISLGIAIFLAELAPKSVRVPLSFVVELLAAVPSVVFGLWALYLLRPAMQSSVEPFLSRTLGFLPLFQGNPGGYDVLTAGTILAIMIIPTVTATAREVILAAPREAREAAYALGATRWEVVRRVVLPQVRSGIFGAAILGLGRAVGETMAVTMVIGNTPQISSSLFRPGYTMASVLANEFNEATGTLHVAALIEVGLVLFAIALLINVGARLVLSGTASRQSRAARPSRWRRSLRALLARLNPWTTPGRRRMLDRFMTGVMGACVVLALVPLASILYEVISRGGGALSVDFLTKLPVAAGESGGGIANAILGSLIVVGMACVIGVPLGVGAGVYVAEYGSRNVIGRSVRLLNDVLTEFPSIVIGIFVYVTVVVAMNHYSAIAGSIALAIIMLPIIARTTEESLRLVPDEVREAGLALGISKWRSTFRITLPSAKGGIVTGVMLSVARAMGETAPLLFTVLGGTFWFSGLDQPTAAMPLTIYTYATSGYPDWNVKAWGAAFVLLVIVLALNIAVRFITGDRKWRRYRR